MPLIGEMGSVRVVEGDTLVDLAYRHGVGFEPLVRLNPGVKVWIPQSGVLLELPRRMILPDASLSGLVINVPEMRLYDHTDPRGVSVYAVAVGDAADPSPLGRFRVGAKLEHPPWRVPESIRRKRPELPPLVPPGPENPIGSRWMRIGDTSYGIHGTNIPWSIGRPATHGCVRLYEAEMEQLFERVPLGSPIEIVYQSVKLGVQDDVVFVEAHPDLYALEADRTAQTLQRLAIAAPGARIDPEALRIAIEQQRGIPIRVDVPPLPASPGHRA